MIFGKKPLQCEARVWPRVTGEARREPREDRLGRRPARAPPRLGSGRVSQTKPRQAPAGLGTQVLASPLHLSARTLVDVAVHPLVDLHAHASAESDSDDAEAGDVHDSAHRFDEAFIAAVHEFDLTHTHDACSAGALRYFMCAAKHLNQRLTFQFV